MRRIAWILLSGLLWCGGGAVAGEAVEAVRPDYSGPAFDTIRESYLTGLAGIHSARTTALVRLIQLHVENAELMLKEKSRTRNVTGMAVANNAKSIFEAALSNVTATGRCDLPDKVRRELEPMMEEFKAARDKIEKEFDSGRETLSRQGLEAFRPLAVKANPALVGDDALKKEFLAWIETRPVAAAPVKQAVSGTVPGGVASVPDAASPAYWGTSGEAKSWVTIGLWEGKVASMDVLAISLAEMQVGTNRSLKANPIAGMDSQFEYIARYRFPTNRPVAVRLKSVTGHDSGEVLDWPEAGNDFTLSVRLVADRYPSAHAFELQVGTSGGVEGLFPGARSESASGREEPPPTVFLGLSTQPPGAAVWIDGAVVKDARTPCRVPVSAGTHTVEVVLQGFESLVISNEVFATNRVVKWNFRPDPRLVVKTCSLSADAVQWYPSGIIVPKDAVVSIKAEGEWACGARGERCTANGYPETVPTYRHYADPALRQVVPANYGALLGRIGKDGAPFVVGASTRIKAASRGLIYFDVNEATGKTARADNSGELSIKVGIIPPPGP